MKSIHGFQNLDTKKMKAYVQYVQYVQMKSLFRQGPFLK